MTKDPYYVLMHYGEIQQVTDDLESILDYARTEIEEHLSTFYGPRPFKITEDDISHIDLNVYKLTEEAIVLLPYQEWADEYYQARERELLDAEEHEYQRYLCLHTKWEIRRIADARKHEMKHSETSSLNPQLQPISGTK